MFTIVYILYGAAHLALLIWGFRLYQRAHHLGIMLFLVVLAALVYDNWVIAAGSSIGEGEGLKTLNQVRFLLHALFTPLFVYTGYTLAQRANVSWAQNPLLQRGIWGIVAVLVVLGLLTGFIGQDIYPACFGDTLRYAERVSESQLCREGQEIHTGGIPPIAAIVTILIVAAFAFGIWRTNGWVWLLAGAVIMIVTAAVPASRVGPWVGSGGEIVFAFSILLTAQKLLKTQ